MEQKKCDFTKKAPKCCHQKRHFPKGKKKDKKTTQKKQTKKNVKTKREKQEILPTKKRGGNKDKRQIYQMNKVCRW
jgi:hypothetical protein